MSQRNETFEEFFSRLNGVNGNSISSASEFMGNVNEAVGPFIPFIAIIATLTREIVKAYENVQYNKSTCRVLVERVVAAEDAIKILMKQKEENIDQFLTENYYNSFERYVNCLKKIKEFCNDISQLSKFKKFFSSERIKEIFQEIIREFDSCSADLNLAVTTNTTKDLEILHSDMIEMKKFLDNVGGGITSIDDKTKEIIANTNKIKIQNKEIILQNIKIIEILHFTPLNEEINNIFLLNEKLNTADDDDQDSKIEAKRIIPSELRDASQHVIREGSRVIIKKKIYKEMDVACKPIVSMDNIQKIQKHLAILEKLNICPYIIQFHGLSKICEENVMVFEWAEHKTLRDLYLSFKISWEAKISIARDICRGLAFLHSVNILHHNLRCEHILITDNMLPKISNFDFAREFNAATHPIDNFNDIIHWLAPEKLECIIDPKKRDNINRYTIQCEIFSFGMLLWELGFQRKPYEDKTLTEILGHVLKGGRETLDIELHFNPVKKEYCNIVKLAWDQEASLRPGIRHLFNMLQDLYDNHVLKKGFSLLHPINQVEKSQDLDLDISNYCPTPSFTPLIPFEEGLQANKECNYEKAWKCFEQHANIGDMEAKYWQGLYYSQGYYVERDQIKAKELFKEAADTGNSEAQVRYAFCLLDKVDKKEHIEFLKYLKMSANNDNATALYNLGKIYLFGQCDVEKDQNKGIKYLKRAASKGEPKSLKFLKDHNITFLSVNEE
ncbi:kinase-like protein [Rhizophagus irregularis]|uniref:Kinase-like protein n=1 Tax=Rhizophagus irregularis TaxID=588596 RepID=A0A2N0Q5G5_9GLOM|nr:kinase-like protein [Rhizophagus irregularis]